MTLTFPWPAGQIRHTYRDSFHCRWHNIIPLFLHPAIYLEVSLFRWTSQNAFSRKTAVYKWYCVQCCIAALHTAVGIRCPAHCAGQRMPTTRPTTFHYEKSRGCQCSFRLLVMGDVSPETCWALYKYGIIQILIHCCTLLDFSLWIVLWCTDPQISCFGTLISPSSGSWHQNFFKSYGNKIGHNKHT